MEDEVDLVSEKKRQDKHEEVTNPRMVESYRPPIPFPQRLVKAKLDVNCGKFL